MLKRRQICSLYLSPTHTHTHTHTHTQEGRVSDIDLQYVSSLLLLLVTLWCSKRRRGRKPRVDSLSFSRALAEIWFGWLNCCSRCRRPSSSVTQIKSSLAVESNFREIFTDTDSFLRRLKRHSLSLSLSLSKPHHEPYTKRRGEGEKERADHAGPPYQARSGEVSIFYIHFLFLFPFQALFFFLFLLFPYVFNYWLRPALALCPSLSPSSLLSHFQMIPINKALPHPLTFLFLFPSHLLLWWRSHTSPSYHLSLMGKLLEREREKDDFFGGGPGATMCMSPSLPPSLPLSLAMSLPFSVRPAWVTLSQPLKDCQLINKGQAEAKRTDAEQI